MARPRKAVVDGKKVCSKCELPKPIDDFSVRKDDSRYLTSACRGCANKRKRDHNREVYEKLAEIKLALGCADCGYNEHPAALDFDHMPGVEKLFSMNRARALPWKVVLAEIRKCEVVCANCHRVRTVTRNQHGRK